MFLEHCYAVAKVLEVVSVCSSAIAMVFSCHY